MAKRNAARDRSGSASTGLGGDVPRTVLVNSRVTPRFAGVCTFCRFPRLEDLPRDGGGPGPGVDWCVFGVPFDTGVTFRPGARFGPRAVRDASQYVKPYHLEHGVNVAQVLRCCDAGDAPVKPYSIKDTLESVKAWVVETARAAALPVAKPAKMLAIGGDHSIAYACIAAARELHSPGRPLAIIHLDSHLDTVDSVWGEQWGHASPFRRLIDDGVIDPAAMLSIGVKGPLNTAADLDYAREKKVTLVTHAEYQENGPARVRKFISGLRGRPVYITFDIDVVDPAFAPGTGTPSVGGFTSAEALAILRSLKGINVVGADVVEVLPDRDVSQITAMLAGHVAFEILALDAVGR